VLGEGFRRDIVSSETEIKFTVDKERRSVVIEGLVESAGEPSTYESIYFDTDDLRLKRNHVELCLRNKGGHLVQRIKARRQGDNGRACRSAEISLSALQPNLDHVRTLIPPNVRDAISPSALKPCFRTRFSRISHQFANDSRTTQISFDDGHIEARGRSQAISEVEFKLKGGELASYTKDCLAFLGRVPAALLVESKAARGYRLAADELPCAVSASDLIIPWNVPLPEAITGVLRHSFQHFLDNHPAVTLGGAPESIHQMRVAMRRLRSAIRMFGPVLRLESASSLLQRFRAIFTAQDIFLPLSRLPMVGTCLESIGGRKLSKGGGGFSGWGPN
jgi:triphosphatase